MLARVDALSSINRMKADPAELTASPFVLIML